MKKFIVSILCIFIFGLSAFASSLSTSLTEIENSMFGYDYKKESDLKRIERIEENLYGNKKAGDINKRLETIKTDIGYVSSAQRKLDEMKMRELQKAQKQESQLKQEDLSVDYPVVDKMEKQVFNTTYKKENIYQRLSRLEQHVFNKTSNESLNDRVDKLSSILMPQKHAKNDYDSIEKVRSSYSQSGLESFDKNSVDFQLAVLEQNIFKNQFEKENNISRLNRLEQAMFNKTYATDNDEQRLQRLMVAYEAKKDSYKYENNKRMQNMATTSQIGGFLLMLLALIL